MTSLATLAVVSIDSLLKTLPEDVLSALGKRYLQTNLTDLWMPKVIWIDNILDGIRHNCHYEGGYLQKTRDVIRDLRERFPECVTQVQGPDDYGHPKTFYQEMEDGITLKCKAPDGLDPEYHNRLVRFFEGHLVSYEKGVEFWPLCDWTAMPFDRVFGRAINPDFHVGV